MFKKIAAMFLVLIALTSAVKSDATIKTYDSYDVQITKLRFIYIETYGNLLSNFEQELSELESYALRYGLSTTKKAVLFLEDGVLENLPIEEMQHRPESVTEEFLEENYHSAAFKSNRKVAVGVLVFPSNSILLDDTYKYIDIGPVTVSAFQSVLTDDSSAYTAYDLAYDRIVAMKTSGISSNSQDRVGTMEYYDSINNVYTFFALPGSQEAFLSGEDFLNTEETLDGQESPVELETNTEEQ